MNRILFLLVLTCTSQAIFAQYVYTIKADSVKITNSCDTAELIIENHTQTVPGFLYNKGRGRTEFRRVLLKINDSIYIVGGDTLKINPWLQGGNRFGTTGSFGTLDNYDIDFYTNNTHRGRWAKNGNFIIGSASDEGQKFQVKSEAGGGIFINPTLSNPGDRIMIGNYLNQNDGQNVLFGTSNDYGATYNNILVERNGDVGLGINSPMGWHVGRPQVRCGSDGVLSFMPKAICFGNTVGPKNSSALVTGVSDYSEWKTDTGVNGYPSGRNSYYFGTQLNGPTAGSKRAPLYISARELLFMTGGDDATAINAIKIAEAGNVLIGTDTDNGNKLQVTGHANVTGNFTVSGNTIKFAGLSGDNSMTRILAADVNGNLFFRDASTVFNNIHNSDLAVNGTLSAQKMLISQTGRWPDYVFSKQYDLPSLAEVESFIKQNNHLPAVPSAAEVAQNGVDVAGNQATLLKKIEELTLYAIEQEKKLQKQSEEINELKNKNIELELLKQQMAELKALIKKQ